MLTWEAKSMLIDRLRYNSDMQRKYEIPRICPFSGSAWQEQGHGLNCGSHALRPLDCVSNSSLSIH